MEPTPSFKGVWNSLTSVLSRLLINNSRNVTLEELKTHIPNDKLLSSFGGSLKFSNKNWIQERLLNEPQQQFNKDLLKTIEKKEENDLELSGASLLHEIDKTQKILASYFTNLNNDGVYTIPNKPEENNDN